MRGAQGWLSGWLHAWSCDTLTQAAVAVAYFSLICRSRALVLLLCSMLASPLASADVRYVYDGAGRLVQVIAEDGSSARYRYDPAGNISAIERLSLGELALTAFVPTRGPVGVQVKLQGSGFASTPTANTVTFNGSAAEVLTASESELVVVVPAGASTGPIAISVAGNSAASGGPFTVSGALPVITGFTPKVVNPGANVTVTGSALEPVTNGTQVAVGRWPVQEISYSDTALTFGVPSSARSGTISVTTAYGRAQSVDDLVVVPNSIPGADVTASAQLNIGAAPVALSMAPGKRGVLAVRAVQGQYVSVQITSLVTTPASASVNYQILSPTLTQVATGAIAPNNKSIHLPRIAMTGTHLVVFSAETKTVDISATVELSPVLTGVEPPVTVATTASYQTKRFIMRSSAGDDMSIAVSQLVTVPSNVTVEFGVRAPNGTMPGQVSQCTMTNPGSNCNWWAMDVPLTGDYVVSVGSRESTATFDLAVSKAQQLELTTGETKGLNITRAGQFAVYTFNANAGDTAALRIDSPLTAPAGQKLQVELHGPPGTNTERVAIDASWTKNLRNLAAGTYRLVIVPWFGLPASADVLLAPGLTQTVAADAVTRSFSTTVPEQIGYFTFAATAGQNIGVGLSALTLSPNASGTRLALLRPDGQELTSNGCYTSNPGCNVWALNVPQTGNYVVVVTAPPAQASFDLTVSTSAGGAIIAGAMQALNLTYGQFGVYTFTATTGQAFAAYLDSIATLPAGTRMEFAVYGAGASPIVGGSITGATTRNVSNLAAGTYRIVVVPWYGVRTTAQVTLEAGAGGAVAADGIARSFSTSVPSQDVYLTFAATAGQNIGVGLTGWTASPSSGASANLTLIRPDGGSVASQGCSINNPSCNLWKANVPQTGTYRLVISTSAAVMNFNVVVSEAVSGLLTAGVVQPINIGINGQFAVLSFTTTASQNVVVNLTSLSTTPAGHQATVVVHNSSDGQVAGGNNSGNQTYNLTNLAAGTYRIIVVPWFGVTATAQLSYQ